MTPGEVVLERSFLDHVSSLTTKVNELERKLDFVLTTLNLEYLDSGGSQEYPQVEALIGQGRKLEAIQAFQLATGTNLNDARAAVENMARRLGK